MGQLDLFASTLAIYRRAQQQDVSNDELYHQLQKIQDLDLDSKNPVGKSAAPHNLVKRKVRWFQQTLKQAGVIERVEGKRGVWRITEPAAEGLNRVLQGYSLVGFSTDLGVAILGNCTDVFSRSHEPIHLILSSPPYPLATSRRYSNPTEAEFVKWICDTIEPLIRNMADGASLALNLGNDIFLSKSPARSMYKERLILALADRFGLQLMDNLIWHNTSKPPTPFQWASKQRFQLNAGYENVIWMCNNPLKSFADNRRVLQPHSEEHLKLMARGGEQRTRVNSDGAHRIVQGAYGNVTEGRIPRNVIQMGHACRDQQEYKRYCRAQGITPHGATMPLKLARFLVEFLSRAGQLVADPFGGSFTTAKAAEELERRWISTDIMLEYVLGSAYRFRDTNGFTSHLRMAA